MDYGAALLYERSRWHVTKTRFAENVGNAGVRNGTIAPQEDRNVEELSIEDMEQVSGGSLASDVGSWLGSIIGTGAKVMSNIDAMENPMLGAMQYGA